MLADYVNMEQMKNAIISVKAISNQGFIAEKCQKSQKIAQN